MKICRLALAALALLAFTSPLAAATSAADEAFLRTLAAASVEEPQVQEPLEGFGTPAPSPRACSISRDCGDGNTVSCVGQYSCANSIKGVKCDTTEYQCPNYCAMSWTCEECPNYVSTCWSLTGDCGVTNSGCNGRPQRCICPQQPQYP